MRINAVLKRVTKEGKYSVAFSLERAQAKITITHLASQKHLQGFLNFYSHEDWENFAKKQYHELSHDIEIVQITGNLLFAKFLPDKRMIYPYLKGQISHLSYITSKSYIAPVALRELLTTLEEQYPHMGEYPTFIQAPVMKDGNWMCELRERDWESEGDTFLFKPKGDDVRLCGRMYLIERGLLSQ